MKPFADLSNHGRLPAKISKGFSRTNGKSDFFREIKISCGNINSAFAASPSKTSTKQLKSILYFLDVSVVDNGAR